jgi:large conductance mechanosensitive channel
MGFIEEFKKFAMRGSVVDMAVGIIIGASFGPIVKSAVDDVLMPPIGVLVGGVDLKDFYFVLKDPAVQPLDPKGNVLHSLESMRAAGAVVVAYGSLVNAVLNFLIVAFAVFLLVKGMNRLTAREVPPPPPNSKDCPRCCTSIPIAAQRCPHCTSELAARA